MCAWSFGYSIEDPKVKIEFVLVCSFRQLKVSIGVFFFIFHYKKPRKSKIISSVSILFSTFDCIKKSVFSWWSVTCLNYRCFSWIPKYFKSPEISFDQKLQNRKAKKMCITKIIYLLFELSCRWLAANLIFSLIYIFFV